MISLDLKEGKSTMSDIKTFENTRYAAVVIQSPNFLGQIINVDGLTDWAHNHGALVIAVANPISLAILKPPAEWGETGADIVCGEGQPLGIPVASGGPYFVVL